MTGARRRALALIMVGLILVIDGALIILADTPDLAVSYLLALMLIAWAAVGVVLPRRS